MVRPGTKTPVIAVGILLGSAIFTSATAASTGGFSAGLVTHTSNVTVEFIQAMDYDGDSVVDELDADTDNDGIPDVYEGDVDSDLDGVKDYLDLDSDNDTIPDIAETIHDRTMLRQLDSNFDGRVDDGVALGRNGLANAVELVLDTSNLRLAPADTDSDGVPDYRDLDSDNDGLSDRIEHSRMGELVFARPVTIVDTNSDGFDDTAAGRPSLPFDEDSDRVEDLRDTDSDNDGLSDLNETMRGDANNEAATDRDNNGRIDQFLDQDGNGYHDHLQGSPLQFSDRDNDGLADHLDLDSDNDGAFDISEAGFRDSNGDGRLDDPNTQDSNNGSGDDTAGTGTEVILVTGLNGNAHGGCSISATIHDKSASRTAIAGRSIDLSMLAFLLVVLIHYAYRRITVTDPD